MAERGPADQCGCLGRQYRFELPTATEEQARALFDDDVDGPFAFFVEQLGVRLLGAGGHPPVDGAHVIAGLVDAHLIEIHAAAAQLGMMQPHQRAAPVWRGEQRDLAHTVTNVDEFGQAHPDTVVLFGRLPGARCLRLHQATATTSRMRWMTRS